MRALFSKTKALHLPVKAKPGYRGLRLREQRGAIHRMQAAARELGTWPSASCLHPPRSKLRMEPGGLRCCPDMLQLVRLAALLRVGEEAGARTADPIGALSQ